AVGRGWSAEDLRHAARGAHALAAAPRQTVEVRVTRRDLAVKRGDADDRAFEVLVEEAHGPEHRPVRRTPVAASGRQTGPFRSACHCHTFTSSERLRIEPLALVGMSG